MLNKHAQLVTDLNGGNIKGPTPGTEFVLFHSMKIAIIFLICDYL